jgi:hypothetical protein
VWCVGWGRPRAGAGGGVRVWLLDGGRVVWRRVAAQDGTINYEEFLRMLLPKTLKFKVTRTEG